MTMENTFTEGWRTSIFSSAKTRSERQSFQFLHLSQGTCKRKVTAFEKRDREPSRLPCIVLKSPFLVNFLKRIRSPERKYKRYPEFLV